MLGELVCLGVFGGGQHESSIWGVRAVGRCGGVVGRVAGARGGGAVVGGAEAECYSHAQLTIVDHREAARIVLREDSVVVVVEDGPAHAGNIVQWVERTIDPNVIEYALELPEGHPDPELREGEREKQRPRHRPDTACGGGEKGGERAVSFER